MALIYVRVLVMELETRGRKHILEDSKTAWLFLGSFEETASS